MERRAFLEGLAGLATAALLPLLPRRVWAGGGSASGGRRRSRPSDAAWPSDATWQRLHDAVGGNLVRVDFPLSQTAADEQLWHDLKNPYFIGDQPGLTQTLGWVDAWDSRPSVCAVAAQNARHIAHAVDFARQHDLRLVVKGGGHSYQGTSNAPDSLLIWTRHMHEIEMHTSFVPQGCERVVPPQPAVTLGAGTIWKQAYDAVTTKGGRYVQGGGCTTVGVAGLIQSGGFGSFSKRYGTAAASLLEAEVVTANGEIRIANACRDPDLFWALKGGGGGTFGVVSRLTLRTHALPEFFGVASFTVRAASDQAYRRLLHDFVGFYREHLFNDHWGEQAHVRPDNTLEIQMVSQGLDTGQAKAAWQPFLDQVERSPDAVSIQGRVVIGSIPARHFWDAAWWEAHWPEIALPRNGGLLRALVDDILPHLMAQPVFDLDDRAGASPDDFWWKGDASQVGQFLWGYESLWLAAALLEPDARQRLADALFEASRSSGLSLHFNKGLAGASPDVIAEAKDTATNPAVLEAFALAIAADGQGPAYPGIPGHEPSVEQGRKAAARIHHCMGRLRALVPSPGSYVSESSYFEKDWQQAYWGTNHARLARIKQEVDPDGLFIVHNGVGSEEWSADGFTRARSRAHLRLDRGSRRAAGPP